MVCKHFKPLNRKMFVYVSHKLEQESFQLFSTMIVLESLAKKSLIQSSFVQ